jgi:hypothetical protein
MPTGDQVCLVCHEYLNNCKCAKIRMPGSFEHSSFLHYLKTLEEKADFLWMPPVGTPAEIKEDMAKERKIEELEHRIQALEDQIKRLDNRTVGMVQLGGNRLA